MIKLKIILSEAKFDKVADKIWDKIISNKIHVTKSQLKDLSDDHARKGHYNKKELYKAVKRVAKQKNWFTKFIAKTVK
tara:strand:- start:279 stop:512 length:234 start_codon:yes stop_codon:yes gene_type:complete